MAQAAMNQTPPEIASQLLSHTNGIARDAEILAWKEADKYPFDENKRPTQPKAFWIEVAKCIVEKREIPAVERQEYHPSPLTLDQIAASITGK